MGRDAKTRRGPVVMYRGELRITEKLCKKCGLIKPVDAFRVSAYTTTSGNPSKRVACHCLECEKARKDAYYKERLDYFKLKSIEYRRNNPEKVRVAHRRKMRKRALRTFGMTLDDYHRVYDAQGGRCLICSVQRESLSIDHCHSTGAFRGLLCPACNVALGYIRECPDAAVGLARYIKERCLPLKTGVASSPDS